MHARAHENNLSHTHTHTYGQTCTHAVHVEPLSTGVFVCQRAFPCVIATKYVKMHAHKHVYSHAYTYAYTCMYIRR